MEIEMEKEEGTQRARSYRRPEVIGAARTQRFFTGKQSGCVVFLFFFFLNQIHHLKKKKIGLGWGWGVGS